MINKIENRLTYLAPLFVFLLGVGVAVHFRNVNSAPGESGLAALSLLRNGYIGNPYLLPTGPTAHVSPVLTEMVALVFFIFGENSETSRVVLGCLAAAFYACSVYLIFRICEINLLHRPCYWAALALTCAFPIYIFDAVVNWRQWDQVYAGFVLLYFIFIFDSRAKFRRSYLLVAWMALIAGVGALISPAILPTLAATLGLLIRAQREREDYRPAAAIAVTIVVALLLPWGVRNEVLLGKFIVTRSNFGLELALGNHDGAPRNDDRYLIRFHPHDSVEAAQRLAEIGEVTYMQEMGDRAVEWIWAHPARFSLLTAQRAWLGFFPDAQVIGWMPILGSHVKWIFFSIFGVLKVGGLFWVMAWRIRPVIWLLYCVLPIAPYFITHMSLRYEFVTYFPTVVMILFVVDRACLLIFGSGPRTRPAAEKLW